MYPYLTYTMPDGTRSFNKPRDGAIFFTKDGQKWVYDDLYGNWVRKFSINVPSAPEHVNVDFSAHPDFEQDMELAKRQGACECGSDKVKSPIHSSWCPKYSK